ncbi:MAG TPA: hypothetical protein VFI21_04965 [Nocardioides sp.]|nr:hypothetical protein [Nocardioides sp.]
MSGTQLAELQLTPTVDTQLLVGFDLQWITQGLNGSAAYTFGIFVSEDDRSFGWNRFLTASSPSQFEQLSSWGVAHGASDTALTLRAGHTYGVSLIADAENPQESCSSALTSGGELTAQYAGTSQ